MKYLALLLCLALAACNDSGARQQEKKAKAPADAAVPVSVIEVAPLSQAFRTLGRELIQPPMPI